ncbi:hypothetical protein BS47DRAFT_1366554 [Hydnum rufescens UP504]|uniref:Uncharacterized protein n=1 Tax=Hydnum rufescens UP504 TaxID=1448309 RepID=A0A9P6ALH0_9AGAM|nr:hypothetical protein BS47DRAFT_1366554 [Hydnum rufescens UP504]
MALVIWVAMATISNKSGNGLHDQLPKDQEIRHPWGEECQWRSSSARGKASPVTEKNPTRALDSFSIPLEVMNNVQSSQGTMEMDSAPPEVPLARLIQWFLWASGSVSSSLSASLSVQDEDEDGQSVSQDEMADPPVKVKRVLLAFKSQQRRDIVLACFHDVPGFSPWQSTSMTALLPDHHETIGSYRYLWDAEYVEMSYAHQQSPDDLTLLLQNAPACQNIGDLRDLHPFPPRIGDPVDLKFYIHYHFLDFNRYPPLVNPEKISPSRPCILDQVEFTTLWLLALLESEYSVV